MPARWPRSARAAPLSDQTSEVLATFRAISWIQDRFGVAACRRYVVSFTRSAADIAAVYELAALAIPDGRAAGARRRPAVRERRRPGERHPGARRHAAAGAGRGERLAANGRQLEVMLGYSDSAKELGPVSATLRLFAAQQRLARWAEANDVRLTMFHGRGGALGPRRRPGRARGARAAARARWTAGSR